MCELFAKMAKIADPPEVPEAEGAAAYILQLPVHDMS